MASFFTRGVDSWYTALTHGRRPYDGASLTHLVYVPDVDFMYDEAHLQRSIQSTADAARAIGMMPVTIESNLRRHTEPSVHWGHYHGAGLASIGLGFGPSRMLLPAARSYGLLEPEGSHPLLDPLWSTESTEVVHHGAEATRWEKVQFLADHPIALRSLKVCFDANTDGNCGRCPKCLVTMVMLDAVGVLAQCPFDAPLDPSRLAHLDLPLASREHLIRDVFPAVQSPSVKRGLHAMALRRSAYEIVGEGKAALRDLWGSRNRRRPRDH